MSVNEDNNDSYSTTASNLENDSDNSSDTSFDESISELSSQVSDDEIHSIQSPRKGRPPKNYNYSMDNQFQGFPSPYQFYPQQHQPTYIYNNYSNTPQSNISINPFRNMSTDNTPHYVDIRNHYNMQPTPYQYNDPYNMNIINESQHPSISNFNKLSKSESYESLIEKTRIRREQDRERSFKKSKDVESESDQYIEEETITEVDLIEKIICVIKYKEEIKCLVKRRFYSYLHNFWCDLQEMGTQSNMLKYKSFLKKFNSEIFSIKRDDLFTSQLFDNLEDVENINIEIWKQNPPLEPDLLEIERIISIGTPESLCVEFEFAEELNGLVYDGFGGCSFLFNDINNNNEVEFNTELSNKKIIYLIKWKGLSVDLATFEEYGFIYKLIGFIPAMNIYKKRMSYRPCDKSVYERPKIIEKRDIKKFESVVLIKPKSVIKEVVEDKSALKEVIEIKPAPMELRSYQLEGLNWLLNRWKYNQSCIMADEMGLGKTVQSVALIRTVFEMGYTNKVLIVAPLSTIPHWEREFINWSHLNITILHGNKEGRDVLLHYEYPTSDVIITTYEMAMCSLRPERYGTYGIGVFDEAHRLKNANSKATKFFSKLTFGFKLLLSGTPLQNNLTELWSLLNFIDSQKFPSVGDFLKIYKLEKSEDVERLQNTLRPLMLRRMKDDVESIPVKEETVVEVELTMIQKRFYKAILYKNRAYFQNHKKSNEPSFVNIMMELRKCCIHPFLIKGAEDIILTDKSYTESISKYVDSEYYNILIQSSGKLVFLDKLLNKMYTEKSGKVLIFSQMTKCLDLIGMYLRHKNYNFERIDGSVRKELRQEAIDRFSNNSIEDSFVFLLCTRAGGVGINLTAANTCVIFDSDWNPQNDLQAQARCHRIGQTQSVKIYRLVTRNTYEREMFDRASIKLGLDRAVLQKDLKQSFNEINTIESLLKKGAYGILMENDSINLNFISEDIEKMLSNRTKVISHERNAGHIFSKASFGVEEDINDERFWVDLLSEKKNKERDSQIRKQLRRLAREGDFLKEGYIYKKVCEEILQEKQEVIKDIFNKLKDNITIENMGELAIFIMLSVLKNGLKKGLVSIAGICSNVELVQLIPKLNSIVANSIDQKYQDDYLVNIKTIEDQSNEELVEEAALEVDTSADVSEQIIKQFMKLSTKDLEEIKTKINLPENFSRSANPKNQNINILKTFNHFYLLRLQAYNLLKDYTNKISLSLQKGASLKEDEELVKYTLENGYDNYPTSVYENKSKLFKSKKPEELNQRIRKIILCLHSQIHALDLNEIALNFGPINDYNREFIKKECSLDSYNLFLNEIIKKGDDLLLTRLEKKHKRIKSSGYSMINDTEKSVYWRYRLFIDMKLPKGNIMLEKLKEGINIFMEKTGKGINEVEKLMKAYH